MLLSIARLYGSLVAGLSKVGWLGPLLARLTVGWVFAQSGWGKFQNIERVVGFFTNIGIPAPEFQARFVAGHELVCGVLVMVGLATRLSAIPLAIIMVVALATAVDFEGPTGLLFSDEFGYFAIFVWLLLSGPGAASLDAIVARLTGLGQASR